MTFKRKVIYFRLASALAVFLVCWLLLAVTSTLWLDKAAITSELDDKLGIRFLNPNLRGTIHTHGWQVLAALLVAGIFFFKAKQLCTNFLAGLMDKTDPLVVDWWDPKMPIDWPSEYILDTLSWCTSPVIRIQNKGHRTMKIRRIEASFQATKQVQLNDGQHFEELLREVETRTLARADDLIRWTPSGPNKWYIDNVAPLKEKYHLLLPTVDLKFDVENKDTVERIELLIANPTLCVTVSLLFYFKESTVARRLSQPLRIFPIYEKWEDDDPPNQLIGKLRLESEEERERLHTVYHTIGKIAQQARADYAVAAGQAAEKERLIELRHELEPYDRWLEIKPDDPSIHYELGQFLWEQGLLYESLASFQRAEALGMTTDRLHVMIALPLVELDRFDEALDALAKVTDPEAEGAGFFAARGRSLYEKSQLRAAKADLERAVNLDPKNYNSYIFLCLAIRDIEPFEPSGLVQTAQRAVDNGYSNREALEYISRLVGDPEHSAIKQLAERFPAAG